MYLNDLYMYSFNFIFVILMVLLSVAFLTLMERSVLGYIQLRKGPNSVGYSGILQPFGDAIKLFSKQGFSPYVSNFFMYNLSPLFSLFLSLFLWVSFPCMTFFCSLSLGLLFLLTIMSLGVFGLMISGWSSNSNYALLGALRAVAQTVSYEVSFSIIMLSLFFFVGTYNLMGFILYQGVWFIMMSFPLFLCFYGSCLAETNRTPFDFAEGESELVSGFNVEYGGVGFALIFLSEYSMIIFMSFLISLFFLGGLTSSLFFFFELVFMSFSFLWVRGTLPRFRYDKLMYLAWSAFLPVSLNYMMFYMGLKLMLMYMS
uniref:NADH dehydrogenase subunit 1 n=1 Tax=Thoradonta yunnana TaxID=515186 RepID=UPI0023AB19ED|nr:NADH dehydrogenase subunit 1 [Thoradonta yunnana]WCF77162.1 NADH dehydrogenase subunit 1 [Thoradonta yunnana]WCK12012.1 NADH dehydrogenase subunit 1 [Thoradonta yunnana]